MSNYQTGDSLSKALVSRAKVLGVKLHDLPFLVYEIDVVDGSPVWRLQSRKPVSGRVQVSTQEWVKDGPDYVLRRYSGAPLIRATRIAGSEMTRRMVATISEWKSLAVIYLSEFQPV